MLTPIPNQPISFTDSLMMGCVCEELEPALLIDPTQDSLIFQITISPCADATNEVDPDFTAASWKGSGGFFVAPGYACAGNGSMGSTLAYGTGAFTPVPGTLYVLSFIVPIGSVGSIGVEVGGFSTTVVGAGDYSFTFTASSEGQLQFTILTDETSTCIQAIGLYAGPTDIEVTVVQDGSDVFTIDISNDPEYFTFEDTALTANIPMTDTGVTDGCFTVEVSNPCDNVTLTSQVINATSGECTLKVRACNDGASMGFTQSFAPEARLDAKLVRASWEYDVSEERMSNGRISRPYADRQRLMELRIGLTSEDLHPFLSSIPLWDHFYITQEEFVMDAEPYKPIYGDVFDGTGGIVLTVRPKQEKLRKVRCGPENLAGCVPPPNLWVQGTGPNNDYLLTQDGNRILLN